MALYRPKGESLTVSGWPTSGLSSRVDNRERIAPALFLTRLANRWLNRIRQCVLARQTEFVSCRTRLRAGGYSLTPLMLSRSGEHVMPERQCRIHPAIGIARVGDAVRSDASNDFYFIGPEIPEFPANVDPQSGAQGEFKTPDGKVKPQAARFRIF